MPLMPTASRVPACSSASPAHSLLTNAESNLGHVSQDAWEKRSKGRALQLYSKASVLQKASAGVRTSFFSAFPPSLAR